MKGISIKTSFLFCYGDVREIEVERKKLLGVRITVLSKIFLKGLWNEYLFSWILKFYVSNGIMEV